MNGLAAAVQRTKVNSVLNVDLQNLFMMNGLAAAAQKIKANSVLNVEVPENKNKKIDCALHNLFLYSFLIQTMR